jgi:glycosyltransferase involved in cell wall biosynthesis
MRIAIVGPAHPWRGGIATYNERMARQFQAEGDQCELITFSLQYPSLFFPGKTQLSVEPAPDDLIIHKIINSINPINWFKVGRWMKLKKFDLVIIRLWIPFMAPSLGTILWSVRKNRSTKVICIVDNVIPHEHRVGDHSLTRFFIQFCDAFITMSETVKADLCKFNIVREVIMIPHPLYDNFGEIISKEAARNFLKHKMTNKVILFFGFIRKYKGLDILLEAMKDPRIKELKITLLVSGEFYEDEKFYRQVIQTSGIGESVILENNYIPHDRVKYHFCAADVVIQPYRTATQSGVTPLAYHFEKPMIVTNVGGLPGLVPHKKVGLVCEPDAGSIVESIILFYQMGEQSFIPHIQAEKEKYSWKNLTQGIRTLAKKIEHKC